MLVAVVVDILDVLVPAEVREVTGKLIGVEEVSFTILRWTPSPTELVLVVARHQSFAQERENVLVVGVGVAQSEKA